MDFLAFSTVSLTLPFRDSQASIRPLHFATMPTCDTRLASYDELQASPSIVGEFTVDTEETPDKLTQDLQRLW